MSNHKYLRRILKTTSSQAIRPVLLLCLSMVGLLLLLAVIFSFISNFLFELDFNGTILFLNAEHSKIIFDFFRNGIIAAISITITSPMVVGIFDYLYQLWFGKKPKFILVFSWYGNFQKMWRAVISALLCLFICVGSIFASASVVSILYYMINIISADIANSLAYQVILFIVSIACFSIAIIQLPVYLWIFVPLVENPERTPVQCLSIVHKTMSHYRLDCFWLTLQFAVTTVLTAFIGIFYIIPYSFMTMILLYKACQDLDGNAIEIPSELFPDFAAQVIAAEEAKQNQASARRAGSMKDRFVNWVERM